MLTSFGSFGDVYPHVGLALGLAERGHQPVIATSAFFRSAVFEGQYSPTQVLGLFSPLLAKTQPDWPPNARLTGAIPYNGQAMEQPLAPELEAFLAAGEPPIVFTLGSAAGAFYRESVAAVRRLGARAVLLIGSHPDNRPEAELPDSVHVEPFAPHAALFPRAAVIMHPAGIGTVHQCLRAGRPSLAVPYANDQPDNAYRLERLGVSRTLRPGRYRAQRVARELGALLSDSTYLARARALAAMVRAEDGVAAACDAIEERFR